MVVTQIYGNVALRSMFPDLIQETSFVERLKPFTIAQEALPQKQRDLLVHNEKFTLALRRILNQDRRIRIEEIGSKTSSDGNTYTRTVLLRDDQKQGKVLSVGFININMHALSQGQKRLVLAGNIPFGQILENSGVKTNSEPGPYFKVDDVEAKNKLFGFDKRGLSKAFVLENGVPVYGRHNVLRTQEGQLLAYVYEFAAPRT